MKTYGLIGYPLTHSFSVQYFAAKFANEQIADTQYVNFAIESIEELPEMLLAQGLSGFNVTIPYKESVIEYLHEIDETAEAIGAVNCVRIIDHKLYGYNTDVHGFKQSLLHLLGEHRPDALILGTGGSSKAVAHALTLLGIKFSFVSRRKKAEWYTYQELSPELIQAHPLLINTTPLGMFPNDDESVTLPYHAITSSHYLYDLIYNPEETTFLRKGSAQGAMTKNGMEMLILQAERNWQIWNDLG
jgi:shikimate dehydrogenase